MNKQYTKLRSTAIVHNALGLKEVAANSTKLTMENRTNISAQTALRSGTPAISFKPLLAPVPTSIWWKIKLYLVSIFWALSTSETKKSWKEFYYGMIPHKCEFDYDKKHTDKYGSHFECKHYGCNIVTMRDKQGNWL